MQKFLVIQTAFIGDVVLATAIIEKLHAFFPDAQIDFLLRKGNEDLLKGHPFLHETLIWDKKKGKLRNLWKMGGRIRRTKYDKVINVQRFAATGLLTAFSGAKQTIGFDKNPLSWLFTKKVAHIVSYNPGNTTNNHPAHEIERNQQLISGFTDLVPVKPRLYPSAADYDKVLEYRRGTYITVSPASVWFTKQYPKEKWVSFIDKVDPGTGVYLLGAPSDKELTEFIRSGTSHPSITDLSGRLSFLQSAALMEGSVMNYVNDSAPMHFASSVNAPVTAVYCSTIPAFGFGPLSDLSRIVEIKEPLDCRPCGLHGYKTCPLGHFHCATKITDEQLLSAMEDFLHLPLVT
ncbi:glycosyltransferase family 9 protein [Flavitalea flava]